MSTAPPVDEETAAALTLYNTYVSADRERQAHERAVRKAEKSKDDAAAAVRKLNDRKAPADETAAAEAAYREAVDTLKRVRTGETTAGADHSEDDETTDPDEEGEEAASPQAAETDATDDATETDEDDATNATNATETDDDKATETDDSDDATETDEAAETNDSDDDEASASVGVQTPVGDDHLAGDEPAGVAGEQ